MDEFIKVSPGKKELLRMIDNLKIGDMLEIVPDRRGQKGVFFVRMITQKVVGKNVDNF